MSNRNNKQLRRELVESIMANGGHLSVAQYILGHTDESFPVSDKLARAKELWDGNGTVEDVVKALGYGQS